VSARSVIDDRRQRRLLVGLALLFFAPVGLSFYLYYAHSALQPGGRVNAGDLVVPPRPLPPLSLPLAQGGESDPGLLRHKWTLLIVAAGSCTRRCPAALYDTRQVRLALDRDMVRVQRVFLATGECCDTRSLGQEHPDLITLRASAAAAPWLAQLQGSSDVSPAEAQRIYVIDPLGNFMMSYAPNAKAKGMLEDMKRLLKLSHIG